MAALESAGQVVRTFGGARLAAESSLLERTFGQKRELLRREKETIAREAARLVSPGMTVALDSGTTVWRVAAALNDTDNVRECARRFPLCVCFDLIDKRD